MTNINILIQVLQTYTYINYTIEIRKTKGKQTFNKIIGSYFYYKNINNIELFHRNNFANLVNLYINIFNIIVKFRVVSKCNKLLIVSI